MKVAVFGGSGRIGRYVVADLIANGHAVVNADQKPPPHVDWLYDQSGEEYFITTDVTSIGDVAAVLHGVDVRSPIDGYTALISIDKAAQVMGWHPQYAWHDE